MTNIDRPLYVITDGADWPAPAIENPGPFETKLTIIDQIAPGVGMTVTVRISKYSLSPWSLDQHNRGPEYHFWGEADFGEGDLIEVHGTYNVFTHGGVFSDDTP